MMHTASPIHVTKQRLDRRDAEQLLAMHHTGRMAFAFHDRVTMRLLNYVYAKDWIYARLEYGPALRSLQHHHWVVFEVDEIRGIYDWRTVIVHGSVQFLIDDRSSPEWRDFNHALELLRGQVPSILTNDDPAPERLQLFRIHVDECIGSESRSNRVSSLPPA